MSIYVYFTEELKQRVPPPEGYTWSNETQEKYAALVKADYKNEWLGHEGVIIRHRDGYCAVFVNTEGNWLSDNEVINIPDLESTMRLAVQWVLVRPWG